MELECQAIDAGQLIPHRGSMLLVHSVLNGDPLRRTGTVLSILQADKPYWNASRVFRPHWLLEIMAQSAAAVLGSMQATGTAPQPGFLLSIREWTLVHRAALAPGDQLRVDVQIETEWEAMSQASLQIRFQENLLAEARMSFFQGQQS